MRSAKLFEISVIKIVLPITAFIVILGLESSYPLFKDRSDRLRHGLKNLLIFLINTVVVWVLFSRFVGKVLMFSGNHSWGFVHLISLHSWLRSLFLIILFDLWMYIWHRANHRIRFLWRFHRMHHSDPSMDVTTATRFHAVELILSSLLRLGVFLLMGMDLFTLFLYETIMMVIIYFHHSNFYLPGGIDRILRCIIVTPWMHWVHHSKYQPEMDSNYGTIFSMWDRLAGSFRLKKNPSSIQYGLGKFSTSPYQTVWGMLKTPFVLPK